MENLNNLKVLVSNKDTWTTAEGSFENAPFLLRFRPHLKPFIDSGKFDNRLIILWVYKTDDSCMLPSKDDMALMATVEDTLVASLETDVQAILSFVYTNNGHKEWHWHTRDSNESKKRINQALANLTNCLSKYFLNMTLAGMNIRLSWMRQPNNEVTNFNRVRTWNKRRIGAGHVKKLN